MTKLVLVAGGRSTKELRVTFDELNAVFINLQIMFSKNVPRSYITIEIGARKFNASIDILPLFQTIGSASVGQAVKVKRSMCKRHRCVYYLLYICREDTGRVTTLESESELLIAQQDQLTKSLGLN